MNNINEYNNIIWRAGDTCMSLHHWHGGDIKVNIEYIIGEATHHNASEYYWFFPIFPIHCAKTLP